MMDIDTMYTSKDIADIIGVGKQAVLLAIRTGRLKARKVGGSYFITHNDLTEYLEYRKAAGLDGKR